MKTEDPKALRRFCGAVLEYRHMQPYKTYLKKTIEELADGSLSDEQHEKLIEAIILNTVNQKAYPFEMLQRKYSLPINHAEFSCRKNRFYKELAEQCGFPKKTKIDSFTKKDVMNMLFFIADEANECIVKDGAFNHQVAGVALKAIDQAVRLSGMYTEEKDDDINEIVMDEPSRKLGA